MIIKLLDEVGRNKRGTLVILNEAKDLYEDGIFFERSFASLKMTWIGTPFSVSLHYPNNYSMFMKKLEQK